METRSQSTSHSPSSSRSRILGIEIVECSAMPPGMAFVLRGPQCAGALASALLDTNLDAIRALLGSGDMVVLTFKP